MIKTVLVLYALTSTGFSMETIEFNTPQQCVTYFEQLEQTKENPKVGFCVPEKTAKGSLRFMVKKVISDMTYLNTVAEPLKWER